MSCEAGRRIVGVVQEIESADLVRAIVGTVPRAHATVISHLVEPFVAVRRRSDRADELAGGFLAMHAGHGLKIGAGDWPRLRLRNSDRSASSAFRVSRGPAPCRRWECCSRPDRRRRRHRSRCSDRGRWPFPTRSRHARLEASRDRDPGLARAIRPDASKSWILTVLFNRSGPDQVPAHHGVMMLNRGQFVAFAGRCDLEPRAEPGASEVSQRVDIGTDPGPDLSRPPATISERDSNRSFRLTRHDPGGNA